MNLVGKVRCNNGEHSSMLVAASSVFPTTGAQEGYYGVGHDKWHQGFYSKPKMPSRFLSFANC
jgi:hypothetical protein